MCVAFYSPTSIATMANTITFPSRNFSTGCPFNVAIKVSTLDRIIGFTISKDVSRDRVTIIPSSVTSVTKGRPTTIKAPLGPLISINMKVFVFTIRNHASEFIL